MPNWCYNNLTISNPKVFKDKCMKEGRFQFNNIIPRPAHMDVYDSIMAGLGAGVAEEAKEGNLSIQEATTAQQPIPNEVFVGVTLDYLQVKPYLKAEEEKTGVKSDSWYEWDCEKWGTKWDLNGDEVDVEELDKAIKAGDSLDIHFDTAWSPPLPVLEKMAELGVKFNWSCEEEGDFYAMEGESDGESFSCWDTEVRGDEDDEEE